MASKINIIAGSYVAFNFEALTISSSVVGLTAKKYTTVDSEIAKKILLTVENAQIRYKYNGENPSATEGHILNPMDVLSLKGSVNIQNLRLTRKGSSDAIISVTYEN